jgi:hypothetical protein
VTSPEGGGATPSSPGPTTVPARLMSARPHATARSETTRRQERNTVRVYRRGVVDREPAETACDFEAPRVVASLAGSGGCGKSLHIPSWDNGFAEKLFKLLLEIPIGVGAGHPEFTLSPVMELKGQQRRVGVGDAHECP